MGEQVEVTIAKKYCSYLQIGALVTDLTLIKLLLIVGIMGAKQVVPERKI